MYNEISIPPKRLEVYNRYLIWTRKWQYTIFTNTHFNNELWHCLDEWQLFIGFDKLNPFKDGLFKREEVVYDGHKSVSYCLLGITVGSSYTYRSTPLKRTYIE